ncbi:MAG: nucleotidyltransferase domain-containing protein [Oscillospiraceae bacterium]|nr:nucleotidyltransferase domain-containing protein [Oscillospiraceae bacterium]
MDFGLSSEHLKLIRDEIKKLGIEKAAIFGSRAKGNFKPNSDIDIAIWAPSDVAAKLASELDELPTPYKFDCLYFDSIQNEDLKEHILRVGKELT